MKQLALALAAAAALPLLAQQPPNLRGATISAVRASGDLQRQIVSFDNPAERVWVGYSVKMDRPRQIEICCGSWNCGACSLDGDSTTINVNTSSESLSDTVALLYRVKNGAIATIRAFSNCSVNADGARIYWLEGVDPRASVSMLDSIARSEAGVSKKALFALSLHGGATDALIDIAHHASRSKTRSEALFWLAQTAADKAANAIRDAIENDPDEDVRGKAVFAVAQLPDDQSIPMLTELMRTHHSRNVRKKAAFWLGQKNDPRALAAIEEFLRR